MPNPNLVEDEKDEIVNSLNKDIFGIVSKYAREQVVLCADDDNKYTQKIKAIRGVLILITNATGVMSSWR